MVDAETAAEILADKALQEELLLEEDDDPEFAKFRELRMAQLRQEMNQLDSMATQDHGTYQDVSEPDFLKITTKTEMVVAHFYHADFSRCQIMHKHLETLSRKHFKTRFIKVDVERAGFFVEKLKVQVLPCVIAFLKGAPIDRIVGFDELGAVDNFRTEVLEKRLAQSGIIEGPTTHWTVESKANKKKGYIGQNKNEEDDD